MLFEIGCEYSELLWLPCFSFYFLRSLILARIWNGLFQMGVTMSPSEVYSVSLMMLGIR